MAGMFDDLIPQGAAPSSGGGMFDDLIPKSKPSVGEDIARTTVPSLARGALGASTFGVSGVAELANRYNPLTWAGDWAARKFAEKYPETAAANRALYEKVPHEVGRQATSGQVENILEEGRLGVPGTGEWYKSQTTPGKFYGTMAEFVPAMGRPTGLVDAAGRVIRRAVVPGGASEAAGEATEGTAWEPWARVAGGIGGLAGASRTTTNAVRRMLPTGEPAPLYRDWNDPVDMARLERDMNAPQPRGPADISTDGGRTWSRLLPPDIPHGARGSLGAAAAGRNPLADYSPEAQQRLREVLSENGIDSEHAVEQAFDTVSSHHTVGELSPGMELETAKIAAADTGNARNQITQTYRQRGEEAPERMAATFDRTVSPTIDPVQWQNDIKATREQQSQQAWQQYAGLTMPVTPQMETLMGRLAPTGALRAADRAMAIENMPADRTFTAYRNGEAGQPSPMAWQFAKEHLDGLIDDAIAKGRANEARRLTQLKNDLVDAIDNHPDPNVANMWQTARRLWQEPTERLRAFEFGRNRLLTNHVQPEDLADLTQGWSPERRDAVLAGVRAQLNALERANRNPARTSNRLLDATLAPGNQQKLEFFMGENRAQEMFDALLHEDRMHGALNRIVGGSPTAGRTINNPYKVSGGLEDLTLEQLAHPVKTATKEALKKVGERLLGNREQKMAALRDEMSRMMTTQGPEGEALVRAALGLGERAPSAWGPRGGAPGMAPAPAGGGPGVGPAPPQNAFGQTLPQTPGGWPAGTGSWAAPGGPRGPAPAPAPAGGPPRGPASAPGGVGAPPDHLEVLAQANRAAERNQFRPEPAGGPPGRVVEHPDLTEERNLLEQWNAGQNPAQRSGPAGAGRTAQVPENADVASARGVPAAGIEGRPTGPGTGGPARAAGEANPAAHQRGPGAEGLRPEVTPFDQGLADRIARAAGASGLRDQFLAAQAAEKAAFQGRKAEAQAETRRGLEEVEKLRQAEAARQQTPEAQRQRAVDLATRRGVIDQIGLAVRNGRSDREIARLLGYKMRISDVGLVREHLGLKPGKGGGPPVFLMRDVTERGRTGRPLQSEGFSPEADQRILEEGYARSTNGPASTRQPMAQTVLERGRSGRPISTEPIPIGTENAILEEGARRNEPPPSEAGTQPTRQELTAMRREGRTWDKIGQERGISRQAAFEQGKNRLVGQNPATIPGPRKWTPEYGMPFSKKWRDAFASGEPRPWGGKITAKTYEQIIDSRNEGKDVSSIAKETGLARSTVQKVFDYDDRIVSQPENPEHAKAVDEGTTPNERGGQKDVTWTPARVSRLHQILDAGGSYAEAAAELGTTRSAVAGRVSRGADAPTRQTRGGKPPGYWQEGGEGYRDLRRLNEEARPLGEIAAHFDVGKSFISQIMKREGLELKHPEVRGRRRENPESAKGMGHVPTLSDWEIGPDGTMTRRAISEPLGAEKNLSRRAARAETAPRVEKAEPGLAPLKFLKGNEGEEFVPTREERAAMRKFGMYKRGGRVDVHGLSMSTRKESNYSPTRGTPNHHCGPDAKWPHGFCEMYRKHNKCSAVAGFIATKGGCDWYRRAAHRAAGGRAEGGVADDDDASFARDYALSHGLDYQPLTKTRADYASEIPGKVAESLLPLSATGPSEQTKREFRNWQEDQLKKTGYAPFAPWEHGGNPVLGAAELGTMLPLGAMGVGAKAAGTGLLKGAIVPGMKAALKKTAEEPWGMTVYHGSSPYSELSDVFKAARSDHPIDGISTTKDPRIAEYYANSYGEEKGKVYPLELRGTSKNYPDLFDFIDKFEAAHGENSFSKASQEDIRTFAKTKNYHGVYTPENDEFRIFDPANIRAKNVATK